MTYATDRLWEEVAYVAFHFHWSFEELLDLEHGTRRQLIGEISKINDRLNAMAHATTVQQLL